MQTFLNLHALHTFVDFYLKYILFPYEVDSIKKSERALTSLTEMRHESTYAGILFDLLCIYACITWRNVCFLFTTSVIAM